MNNQVLRLWTITGLMLGCVLALPSCKSRKTQSSAPSQTASTISEANYIAARESFEEGVKYYVLEDFSKAANRFEATVSTLPDNAAAHFKLAESLTNTKQYEKAVVHAEQAVKIDPDNLYYTLLYAKLLKGTNKSPKAIEALLKYYQSHPKNESLLDMAASFQVETNDLKGAIQTIEKLEAKSGPNENTSRNKISLYLRLNKTEQALQTCQQLIKKYPEQSAYRIMYGEILLSNNKRAEGKKYLNDLYNQTKNPEAATLLYQVASFEGTPLPDTLLPVILQAEQINIDEKVRILSPYLKGFSKQEEAEKVIGYAKLITQAHEEDPKSWAFLGDFYNLSGNPFSARISYLKSLSIKGNTIQVWEQVILLDSQLGPVDSLSKHVNQAVEYFPNNAIFWFYKGRAHSQSKQYKEAIDALEQVKRLSADKNQMYGETSVLLADAYHQTKSYKQSDAAYEEAINVLPDNALVLNNYAYHLAVRKENLPRAKELADKMYKLEPSDPNILDTYGWVLYQLKEYAQAIDFLKRAITPESDGVVYEHLGDAYAQLGKLDAALDNWKLAKAKGGDVTPTLDQKIKLKKLVE